MYSTLLNASLFALLLNGVKLKGSCMCVEFGKNCADGTLKLFQNKSDEEDPIAITFDVIKISQSEAVLALMTQYNLPGQFYLDIPDARINKIGCVVAAATWARAASAPSR